MTLEARWWTVNKQTDELEMASPLSENQPSARKPGFHDKEHIFTESSESSRSFLCNLCFHHCLIPYGSRGYCGVRQASETGLTSPFLGHFCSTAIDPVEKKPLHFWRPGSWILSLGGFGCNMRCPFCQNYSISQIQPQVPSCFLPINDLVKKVSELKLKSVAYTYNEPTLQAEYILKAAPELKEAGVSTVLVTNGLMSSEALNDLLPYIEAVNVDIKSFNEQTYAQMGGCLSVVLGNITSLVQAGIHAELTTLVVPGISDSMEEFAQEVEWIAQLDPSIPLHLSRYFPAHHYNAPATDLNLLQSFQKLAQDRLGRVLLGNA